MTPIINPWVFYLVEVVDNIKVIAGTILVLLTAMMMYILIYTEGGLDEVLRKVSNWKRYFITILVLLIVMIFVPSSETITKMLIAQNVTYERVEVAADTVQTVYEDIMGLFKKNKE